MQTQITHKTSFSAICTIRDWYSSPDSDYPRNWTRRAAAAMRDLKQLNETAFDQVCGVADEVQQFTSGGWTTAYLNGCQVGDSHKGNKIPYSQICIDCLFLIYESEMQRLGFRDAQ
jgi:hypothetical protein